MIVSLASMKGGVGKSTITAMVAKYIVENSSVPVTVVDMDPQCGISIILLGPQMVSQYKGFSIYDALESENSNNPSREILLQAIVTSPYHDLIRVIPSTASLGKLAGPAVSRSLLRRSLSEFNSDTRSVTLVDTGPDITLCEMSIAASDLVFIPITLSAQSGLPTLNTIQAAFKFKRTIGGLIPTMTGKANWVQERIEEYRQSLLKSKLVASHGIDVLDPMPYSQSAARGVWRWGNIPSSFHPMLDAIHSKIFGEDSVFSPEAEIGKVTVVQKEVV